jgi:hypothetical protein
MLFLAIRMLLMDAVISFIFYFLKSRNKGIKKGSSYLPAQSKATPKDCILAPFVPVTETVSGYIQIILSAS